VAHVVRDTTKSDKVDRYFLDYLFAEWEDLPEVEREWPTWEEPSRLLFVLEWPMREDRLATLRQWVADGLLTGKQLGRYRELKALIERHRPIVERLLSEDDPTIPRRAAP